MTEKPFELNIEKVEAGHYKVVAPSGQHFSIEKDNFYPGGPFSWFVLDTMGRLIGDEPRLKDAKEWLTKWFSDPDKTPELIQAEYEITHNPKGHPGSERYCDSFWTRGCGWPISCKRRPTVQIMVRDHEDHVVACEYCCDKHIDTGKDLMSEELRAHGFKS